MEDIGIVRIHSLQKTYANNFDALSDINLQINRGEIFALLGPNGAGKTTLIKIICGITRSTSGDIFIENYHFQKDSKQAKSLIGLVPQELTTDAFETVWNVVNFSRGLFNKPKNDQKVEKILRELSLWDKRNNILKTLSGGMKRRVLIAKALIHDPQVLFLDEPSAGVDVELRKDMWSIIRNLKNLGVTVILTTHYIQEAEELADRIGIINKGKLLLVKEKKDLLKTLGRRKITIELNTPLASLPPSISELQLSTDRLHLTTEIGNKEAPDGYGPYIASMLEKLKNENISVKDFAMRDSNLEEIFVEILRDGVKADA